MKLRKINELRIKLKKLKLQVNIRVKGFSFKNILYSFIFGGKAKTVEEMTKLLKTIT